MKLFRPLLTLVTLAFSFFIISCHKNSVENPPPQNEQILALEKSDKIQFVSEKNDPIENVHFQLEITGKSLSLISDSKGEIALPADWILPARISVFAPGYVALTINDQTPTLKKISLKKIPLPPTLKLTGTVSGIETKDKDGYIDFALITESFNKNSITQLDFNKIISPWTENITVAGYEIPLPQNIFLPKQKESYFISLIIQKLNFVVNFYDYGAKKISALSGRFPFKKVISELQNNKPYYELVNLFEMKSTTEINADFNPTQLTNNIKLNKTSSISKKLIQAPKYGSDQVMIGINCLKNENSIVPLDIKKINPGETTELKSIDKANLLFAGILKNKNEFEAKNENVERISVVLLPWVENLNYQFLSSVENPNFLGKNEFQFMLPKENSQITDAGMKIIISELKMINTNGKDIEFKIPIWEYYNPTWVKRITLPELNLLNSSKYRLEVSFLGKKADNSRNNKFYSVDWNYENQLENSTHITKSAINF